MNKIKEKISEKEEIFYDEEASEKTADNSVGLILKSLLFFVSGFGFSSFNSFGDVSPFAAAFLSAIPFNFCLPCFLGSCLGCFLAAEGYASLKYMGAFILICLFRLIMTRRFKEKDSTLVNCIVSFCVMLLCGLIYLWLTDLYIRPLLVLVSECLLCLSGSFFFITAFRTPLFKGSLFSLPKKNTVAVVISLCLWLMCLSSVGFQGISPGRIFVSVLVMFICLYKGIGAGAVSGVLAGAFLCLSPQGAYLFPAFVLSSLAAGALADAGQVILPVAYTAVFTVTGFVLSDIGESWQSLIEPVIACAVFLLIPASKISSLRDYIEKAFSLPKNITDLQVSDTLRTASDNVYAVAQIVSDVSDRLDKIINPEVNRLFSSLQRKVCDGCEKKPNCWNKDFDMTARDILSIAGIEEGKGGKISLAVTCKRYDLLCNEISASYPAYSAAMASKAKVSEMRRILTDQFITLSDFLSELSVNVCESRTRDKGKSDYLKTILRDGGIAAEHLDCFYFRGRVSVEISFFDSVENSSLNKAKTLLEFITKRRFEAPEIYPKDSDTLVVFREKAAYKIISGYSQRSLKAGSLCGDSVAVFDSGYSFFNAIISDGMGTGSRAAIDSTMAVSMIERLITSDFSYRSALRLVNSALIMKSTDETISTVDAVQINPYTCSASFYKAGGTLSFIRQNDRVTVIEKPSLPMGIIRNTAFAYEERQLRRGDIVLLVSDGVTSQDCSWINDELLAWSKSDMQSLSAHIASLARLRSEKTVRDDITVVALRVERAE